ncbi:major capsid protein [Klebsiella phage CPRSA]|nr:major capsid protein [Klebsiella phage CPRSA]
MEHLLESQEGLPDIATKSKKQLIAAIMEAQEKDAEVDPVYRDEKIVESFGGFLAEAEIAGDHGYDATKIASGNSKRCYHQHRPCCNRYGSPCDS